MILATGGAGQLYPVTSNTFQKNGDGYLLAWDAGADLIDMEQIQFHPTGMIKPKAKAGVLVTEAVRGEGGKLINSENERFMFNYDEKGELATRDVVARSIYNEIRSGRGTAGGGVYLDITHLDNDIIEEKLETMVEQFAEVGVDIKNEAMEVAAVDSKVIDMALKSGWKDFEDAVQNFSAVADPQISAIITRNTKDFKDSSLEVIDSVEFLK